MKLEEKEEGVRFLQGLLKQVGCYSGPQDGRLGSMTKTAVAEFQRREQVPVDGEVTGQTLLLLYRRAGGFFPPGLVQDDAGSKGAAGQAERIGKAGRVV